MNFDELDALMREAGIDICPMCGTPFDKRDDRQKTCGTSECKRLWKNQYLRERRLRLIAEDKEAFNLRHAEAQRKSRHKKRIEREIVEAEAEEQSTMSVEEIDRLESLFIMKKPADRYAELQKEKTLASIPKIDVEGFRKEIETNDNLHDNDT